MGAPDSGYVEIEFGSGNWVPVTDKVEWGYGQSTKYGRQTPYSPPAPAQLQFTLNNADGRFTFGRQGIYWPNVRPGVRVRAGWVVNGQQLPRFFGYVAGWPTSFDETRPRVVITAYDRMKRWAKANPLPGTLEVELLADGASAYWPLTSEQSPVLKTRSDPRIGSSSFVVQGVNTLGDSTGADPASPSSALFPGGAGDSLLSGAVAFPAASTLELAFRTTTSAAGGMLAQTATGWLISIAAGGKVSGRAVGGSAAMTSAAAFNDGLWHHVAVTNPGTTSGTARLFVDGVQVATSAMSFAPAATTDTLTVGSTSLGAFIGNIGHVSVSPTELSAARIATHWQALKGWPGETVDQRVKRLLTTMGVPAAEQNLDASVLPLTWSPQYGVSGPTALQAMTDTEGGGSIVYVEPDGRVRFTNRDRRQSAVPTIVLDAVADLDGSLWAPDVSEDLVQNQVTVTAQPGSVTSTSVVRDDVSNAMFGVCDGGSFTSYVDVLASSLRYFNDPQNNARQRVAANAYPGLRLAQVAVDLWTAENAAALYPKLAGARIGDRIRIVNLPDTVGPARQLDLVIEGWADRVSETALSITFDTSPADNPAEAVWDDATYGRWQGDGETLTAAIAAGDTSLQISSPAGAPTFTVDPSDYPLTIVVGAEHIQLASAPSGSASPQSFTGVTRGVDGTTAAAQAAGAALDVYPTSTWAL